MTYEEIVQLLDKLGGKLGLVGEALAQEAAAYIRAEGVIVGGAAVLGFIAVVIVGMRCLRWGFEESEKEDPRPIVAGYFMGAVLLLGAAIPLFVEGITRLPRAIAPLGYLIMEAIR